MCEDESAKGQQTDLQQYEKRDYVIGGSEVHAIFPYMTDEKSLQLVRNILTDSYIKSIKRP